MAITISIGWNAFSDLNSRIMKTWHFSVLAVLCGTAAACITPPDIAHTLVEPERPQIIFDTDFGGDADDLGALAMLHHYADQDLIDLQAVISWSNEEFALPALVAVNTYYGRPNLTLGVREVAPWRTEWNYNKAISDRFPVAPEQIAEAHPAVKLYRRLLSEAAPHSLTIVTVGPLANIRNLLNSGPDEFSDLSGADLAERKVAKWVIMGGQFPDGVTANGAEWNFDGNMPGVTKFVLETINRPVIFSGFEVGEAIRYGAELEAHPADTPLYVGYRYFSEHAPWMAEDYRGQILDNASFDQTAVMFAALGSDTPFWTLSAPGRLSADARGVATWTDDETGQHRFLKLSNGPDPARDHIAAAMTAIPKE